MNDIEKSFDDRIYYSTKEITAGDEYEFKITALGIGFIEGLISKRKNNKLELFINNFFVDEEKRGTGMGYRLMSYLRDFASDLGIEAVSGNFESKNAVSLLYKFFEQVTPQWKGNVLTKEQAFRLIDSGKRVFCLSSSPFPRASLQEASVEEPSISELRKAVALQALVTNFNVSF